MPKEKLMKLETIHAMLDEGPWMLDVCRVKPGVYVAMMTSALDDPLTISLSLSAIGPSIQPAIERLDLDLAEARRRLAGE